MTFQPGNKLAKGGRKDKPFRDALIMRLKSAGEEMPDLRKVADFLVKEAQKDLAAAKELADRIDGKVPQGIVGDDEEAPVHILSRIELVSPGNE